jgi:PTH1 family peptidyl-tRNA hydrolase
VKLVVGLGNPGRRYASSRHNVGFRIVERWAARRGVALSERRFGGRFGRGDLGGPPRVQVGVLEPETWMNRSGEAVAEALRWLPVEQVSSDLLVVVDDVDLPLGRLRIRPSGSSGGHRGLADVIERLGREDFPRLRFGVGRPPGGRDTADWVLSPFDRDEEAALGEAIEAAADAVDVVLVHGVRAAMDRFNAAPAEA